MASQDFNHPDDLFQSRYVTAGFKPFSYDNNHSKRSINRKRLTAVFDSKEKNKLFQAKLEVLCKHTICTGITQ